MLDLPLEDKNGRILGRNRRRHPVDYQALRLRQRHLSAGWGLGIWIRFQLPYHPVQAGALRVPYSSAVSVWLKKARMLPWECRSHIMSAASATAVVTLVGVVRCAGFYTCTARPLVVKLV